MKVQIASDLHIEFYEAPKLSEFIKPSCNVLIIAGDLGIPYMSSYENFLRECSNLFEHTIIIAGNHEYYQWKNPDRPLTMTETDKLIEQIAGKFNNVHFLNNSTYELNDEYVVLGTTLWSYIPDNCYYQAKTTINDYQQSYYIKDKYLEKINPKITTEIHEKNANWLQEQIAKYHDKKIVIVSHHMPSFQMISEKYKDYPSYLNVQKSYK